MEEWERDPLSIWMKIEFAEGGKMKSVSFLSLSFRWTKFGIPFAKNVDEVKSNE